MLCEISHLYDLKKEVKPIYMDSKQISGAQGWGLTSKEHVGIILE